MSFKMFFYLPILHVDLSLIEVRGNILKFFKNLMFSHQMTTFLICLEIVLTS